MNLQKKLLSGLFWVMLLNLMIKPLWILGIEVGVQNAVGKDVYGFYIALFNFAYIFNILLDVGTTNYNTRNIAQHPQLIAKHLPVLLTMKLMLLVLYAVVTFTSALLWGYGSREFYLLAFLTLNQFLNSLILYLRSNFQGLLLFKWDSVLSILDRAIMIVICGLLLFGTRTGSLGAFRIEWFVYAQTAAYLATALLALGVLLRTQQFSGSKFRLRLNWPMTCMVLKRSLPFALLVLLMACYNRIDPILLQKLAPDGNDQAGIYAGALRLLDALTMIGYLVSVPLLPIYSKLCSRATESQQQIADTTRIVFSAIMVFSITAAVTLSAFAEQLMGLLYHNSIEEYASVFRILIFGIIPISITYVFGTLLTANGSLRQLNSLAAITLAANIGINMALIPRMGAMGSAWASLAAQSFMAVAQMVIALRIFNMRPTGCYILKLLFFALMMAGLSLFGRTWYVVIPFDILWSIVMAILLRLIDMDELKQILKQK